MTVTPNWTATFVPFAKWLVGHGANNFVHPIEALIVTIKILFSVYEGLNRF